MNRYERPPYRPLQCRHCQRVFKRGWNLRRHEASHFANTMPLSCPNCNKNYSSKQALKIHFQKKHNKQNILLPQNKLDKARKRKMGKSSNRHVQHNAKGYLDLEAEVEGDASSDEEDSSPTQSDLDFIDNRSDLTTESSSPPMSTSSDSSDELPFLPKKKYRRQQHSRTPRERRPLHRYKLSKKKRHHRSHQRHQYHRQRALTSSDSEEVEPEYEARKLRRKKPKQQKENRKRSRQQRLTGHGQMERNQQPHQSRYIYRPTKKRAVSPDKKLPKSMLPQHFWDENQPSTSAQSLQYQPLQQPIQQPLVQQQMTTTPAVASEVQVAGGEEQSATHDFDNNSQAFDYAYYFNNYDFLTEQQENEFPNTLFV